MLNFVLYILAPILLLSDIVFGFRSPLDRSLSLPYGRQLRATLSGKIPPIEETVDDLTWWQSIDRNSTIDCKCGTYKEITDPEKLDRWTNEGVTVLNEYPWSVSLVSPGGKHAYSYCGGSLVNDRYVLTAASCVDGAYGGDVEVLIGTWPTGHLIANATENFETDELNSQSLFRKKVHRVIMHPKYTPNVLDYNVALLRLQGPVPTYGNKDGVSPVCLPESTVSYDRLESSSLLWRFHNEDGYIVPEKRSEVPSRIVSKEECKKYNYNAEWAMMPDTMVCAAMDIPDLDGHPYHDTYDCPGDAGGPLLVTVNGKKIQVGIDSWTACYGRPKGVGVFTRVQEFLPWIKLHVSEDGRTCAY